MLIFVSWVEFLLLTFNSEIEIMVKYSKLNTFIFCNIFTVHYRLRRKLRLSRGLRFQLCMWYAQILKIILYPVSVYFVV